MVNVVLCGCAFALTVLPEPREIRFGSGHVSDPQVKVVRDAKVLPEGYRLEVTATGVTITAADDRGVFYARQTMRQLEEKGKGLPVCSVNDWPAYPMRTVQIDDARHFFGKKSLLQTLDWMAYYKFNTLIWHLTDDQGWRVEIKGYPNLTTYGATRRQTAARGKCFGEYDGKQYGPYFYTQEEMREVVAYAKARQIEIIPEICMAGHTRSVVAAYPEFGCPDFPLDERTCWSDWGISQDCICAGNDDVMKFYFDCIDQVCDIFPGKIVHMGLDEVVFEHWRKCAKCQARVKREGLKDTEALMSWMTGKVAKRLRERGRTIMTYVDQVLDFEVAGLGKDDIVFSCGCGDLGPTMATLGYKVISGPAAYGYIDFEQCLENDPCVYNNWIPCCVPLQLVYSFDPSRGIFRRENKKNMLGGVAYNWSEYTYSVSELQWKLWPRLIAMAQTLWNPRGGYDYERSFVKALPAHIEQLRAAGVNCAGIPKRATMPVEVGVQGR